MLQTTSSVSWAIQTRTEIRDRAAATGSVVVVPVGSIEQHGIHLPVATDTLLVDAVATEGTVCADKPGVVLPPVWSGFSPHHLSLGGTLTLDPEHLIALLEDVADAALDNGFDGICFVNGHGGNMSLIDTVVSTVGQSNPDIEITGVTYFQLAAPFIDTIRESETGGMAHGGGFETSLMLHLYPELVREEADAEYLDEPYERGTQDLLVDGPLSTYRPFAEYSASGAIGDPSLASAEKGAVLFERVCDELADVLRRVSEQSA